MKANQFFKTKILIFFLLQIKLAFANNPLKLSYFDESSLRSIIYDKYIIKDIKSEKKNIFNFPYLYSNKKNNFFQSAQIIGRYNGQYHYIKSNSDNNEEWENRRWRIGLKTKFLKKFTLQSEVNLNRKKDFSGDFINSFESIKLKYKANNSFSLLLGMHNIPHTREDGITSGKFIKTLERSLAINQIVPRVIGGITTNSKINDKISLISGIYSASADLDNLKTPTANGSFATLEGLKYRFNKQNNLYFTHFFVNSNPNNNATADYKHSFAISSENIIDKLRVTNELVYAQGNEENNNIFSYIIIPSYSLIDEKLELVTRYQFANSNSDTGIRLARRYERNVAANNQFGKNYHAFYLGLNHFINGEKLKLMLGVEYSKLKQQPKNFDSWTISSAVRFYF